MWRRDPAALALEEIEALPSHRELAARLAQRENTLAPAPVVDARRVFLLLDDRALSIALEDAVKAAGLEVHAVGDFKQLASWLLLASRAATVVFQPPPLEILRNAMIREIRRFAPAASLVALVSPQMADVELAGGARVLRRDAPVAAIVDAVRTPG